jgi:heat shock protein HtpX
MEEQIAANRRRSLQLIIGFGAAIGLVLFAILAIFGLKLVGLVLGVVVGVGATWLVLNRSERLILKANRAVPMADADQPRMVNLLESLCVAAGVTRPELRLIHDPAPNAFTVGRNAQNTTLVVTSGLLERLSLIELEGVLAHELARIRHLDTRVMTVAAATVGAPVLLADAGFGPLGVLAPASARLMQWALSVQSDFLADVTGVSMTRYPPGLIAALEKLLVDSTVVGSVSRVTSPLWIEVPLETSEGSDMTGNRRFVTHPPLNERIALLQEL